MLSKIFLRDVMQSFHKKKKQQLYTTKYIKKVRNKYKMPNKYKDKSILIIKYHLK